MKKFHFPSALLAFLLFGGMAIGQTNLQKDILTKMVIGVENFSPTQEDRNIETISINVLYGWERFKKTPFTFGAGITGTYAWGSITQSNDNFSDVNFENSAFGIGPIFLLKFEPFLYKGLSIGPDFYGGIIFYSDRFPAGGDIYNFMWRMGGSVNYRIPKSDFAFSLSLKWMHVSNGQGLTPKNPSYEGYGTEIRLVKYL